MFKDQIHTEYCHVHTHNYVDLIKQDHIHAHVLLQNMNKDKNAIKMWRDTKIASVVTGAEMYSDKKGGMADHMSEQNGSRQLISFSS